MDSNDIVKIRGIHKSFANKEVVHGVSFNIPKGEVFGLLGPNGAGKTTIIKMILGLLKIDRGEIYINDHSIQSDFINAIKKVGAIVENPEMYPFLTGLDNLRLFSRMHEGISNDRILEVVRQVGLEKRINNTVKTYSLGMKQRLGIAQAILHKPELLILDEPTNGLDPAGIKELREHLKRLAYEENVAILVSSHLLNEMELMCDRFAIIQNGRFVETKTIAELQLTEERIVHLEVDNFEEAQKVIEKYWQDKGLPRRTLTKSAENNHLDVHLDREDCPEIIRLLVENKLKVYRLEPDKLTLEDNFLEITKGEGIV